MNAVMTVLFIVAGLIEGNIVAVARNISISYNVQFISTFILLVHVGMKMDSRNFFFKLVPDYLILLIGLVAGIAINVAGRELLNNQLLLSFVVKGAVIFALYVVLLLLFRQQKVFKR